MKNSLIYCFALVLIVYSITGCSSKVSTPIEIGDNKVAGDNKPEVIKISQKQYQLANMKLGHLMDFDFSSNVRATGMLEVPVKNHIRVSAYAGGYVKNISMVPGKKVRKGEVLFILENPEFVQMQQDFLELKEKLIFLESDYNRQRSLLQDSISSRKKFLKAKTEFRVTQVKMEGLKKRLALIHIESEKLDPKNLITSVPVYSPSSGYVTAVNAMQGMFLDPKDVAIELINTDHLHLEIKVFEKDIFKIKKGQKIRFKIPDATSKVYAGEVYLIEKSVDEENRVISIHGHISDTEDKAYLIPGMYVEAEIVTTVNRSKSLPETAVVSVDGKEYVLVSKNEPKEVNSFQKKEVKTGQKENGLVEILNDEEFKDDRYVLLEGAFNLIQPE